MSSSAMEVWNTKRLRWKKNREEKLDKVANQNRWREYGGHDFNSFSCAQKYLRWDWKMQRYKAKLEKDYLLSWKPYTRRESSSARENWRGKRRYFKF